MRSFQETSPSNIAENTAKHRGGGVGSVVANHRGGGETSMVVTTLINVKLSKEKLVPVLFYNICRLIR